jgi:hypothetical protein
MGTPVSDPTTYPSLAETLQYFTFTRHDIYTIQHMYPYPWNQSKQSISLSNNKSYLILDPSMPNRLQVNMSAIEKENGT